MTDMEIKEKIIKLEKEISGEREKISPNRMDISFGELISLYKNKELIISPDFQRLFRWSLEQRTALIESLLLSIPIPPIFVSEDENGVWELVDGLQRVSTFLSFFGEFEESNELKETIEKECFDEESDEFEEILEEDCSNDMSDDEDYFAIRKMKNNISQNNWVLKEGGLIKSLEGFNIENLPSKYKLNLKRSVCRVEILKGKDSTEMKYELFKRLNSGGTILTSQEIRNAVYRMKNPIIVKTIIELSNNEIFKKYTNLSKQKLDKLDDQELVLKFFAYLNNVEKINENSGKFLDLFLEKAGSNSEFNLEYYKNTFLEVMNLIDSPNDYMVFRNKNMFVPALFEGICVSLAQNIEKYRNNHELLNERIEELKADVTFKKYSGSASNSKTRSKSRLTRANEIFSKA